MERNKENLALSRNFADFYDVDKDDVIGRGHFSTVRRAVHRETGRECAAKFIRRYSRSFNMEDFNFEVQTLTETSGHPYFVNFYGTYENSKEMIIIQELAPGADLFSLVDAYGALPESESVHVIFQLLEAVQYLHSQSIAHLDLKFSPKISFTTLIRLELKKIRSDDAFSRLCGTPEYVAPEVIKFDPITLQTDMWSIGVVTYFILSSISPFSGQNDQETLSNVTNGFYRLDIDQFIKVSQLAKDFIQKLLVSNPRRRMNSDTCLLHQWILVSTIEYQSLCIEKFSFISYFQGRNDSTKRPKFRKGWKIIILVVEACIFLRKIILHSKSSENNLPNSSKTAMNNLCMLHQPCAVLLSC
uniref:Protein kinase domain-containing protein n=1 Tax=Romanomermis culicivorax TaxID=13658 RepID=A0A915IZ28_ROMCU